MANTKRKRTLAGFEDVADQSTETSSDANDNVNIDANKDIYNDTNNDVNTNVNNDANVNPNNETSNNVNDNDDANVNIDSETGEILPGAPAPEPGNAKKPPRAPRGTRSAGGNKGKAEDKKVEEKPSEAQKIAAEDEESGSILDDLLGKSQRIEDTHVMRGIYIEKQLDKIIDRLAKKGGRGVKSKLVNEALKKLFREKGLL